MAYNSLPARPVEKTLMEKCIEKSNVLKAKKEAEENKLKAEREAEQKKLFFDPYVEVHTELLKDINSFLFLEKLQLNITIAMANSDSRIVWFQSGSNFIHDKYNFWYKHQSGINRNIAQDILTTTKYGDKILVDALQERIGKEFKVTHENSSWQDQFNVYVSWGPEQAKGCTIL